MTNRSLAIIKPDAMEAGHQGKIIDRILSAGFNILALRMLALTKSQAEELYAVHQGRPFFDDLTTYMSSGAVMPMVLEKEIAVAAFRELIGATNPAEAAAGTIRKEFATSIEANAIHGSDSDDNAEKEVAFFFSSGDIPGNL